MRRFATSSHAHFQEHDLKSRGFVFTVFLFENYQLKQWVKLTYNSFLGDFNMT